MLSTHFIIENCTHTVLILKAGFCVIGEVDICAVREASVSVVREASVCVETPVGYFVLHFKHYFAQNVCIYKSQSS